MCKRESEVQVLTLFLSYYIICWSSSFALVHKGYKTFVLVPHHLPPNELMTQKLKRKAEWYVEKPIYKHVT